MSSKSITNLSKRISRLSTERSTVSETVSNVKDWHTYKAKSNVDLDSNNLNNAGNIYSEDGITVDNNQATALSKVPSNSVGKIILFEYSADNATLEFHYDLVNVAASKIASLKGTVGTGDYTVGTSSQSADSGNVNLFVDQETNGVVIQNYVGDGKTRTFRYTVLSATTSGNSVVT
jgi:hypothetical protein